MPQIFFIIQTSRDIASNTAMLAILNKLLLSLELVFLGLLILWYVNVYRRRSLFSKKKDKINNQQTDPILSLQNLTREELKQMVMKELAEKKAGQESSESRISPPPIPIFIDLDDESSEIPPAPLQPSSSSETVQLSGNSGGPEIPESSSSVNPAPRVVHSIPSRDFVTEHPEQGSAETSPKAAVERSICSNEQIEQFRHKSRRI